jgi:hypothetical protein
MDYEIYRGGVGDGVEHLQASIQVFYRRHGCFPVQLLVSPKDVEQTRAALRSLDLPGLPVGTTDGCLIGELWLGLGEEGNGHAES